MIKQLITGVVLFTITINIQAQDSMANPEYTDNKSSSMEQLASHSGNGMNTSNMSMSETARETPSGKGKGAIVSSEAKQLGSVKRENRAAENISLSKNGSKRTNWTAMHASSFRRNPDMLAFNAVRAAHRTGPHGKK